MNASVQASAVEDLKSPVSSAGPLGWLRANLFNGPFNSLLTLLILFTAAYIPEVVRGGLQAIAHGQHEAAESLGLGYSQKMRPVILPLALKIVIPPPVSILISAFKAHCW